jgi:glutathione reductase (NADPH)
MSSVPAPARWRSYSAFPMKARCTKDHFDATMAVHPTAAEELVTMYQPSYRIKDGLKAA